MKYKIEKKGQNFLVMNDTTGERKGTFKEEGEAKVYQKRLQSDHDRGIQMVSGRVGPARNDISMYDE